MKNSVVLSVVLALPAAHVRAQIQSPRPQTRESEISSQAVAGLQADLALQALGFSPKGEIVVTLANLGKQAVNPPPPGAPRGSTSGPPIQVDVYLGTALIQTLYQAALAGSASRVLTVRLQSAPPRCGETRALRAVVDPQSQIVEANDNNNAADVAAARRACPDLAIRKIERDFSGIAGETYSPRVTIVNQGDAPAPAHQAWATSLPTGVWPVTGWPELVPTEAIPELSPGETKTFHVGGSVLATSRTAVRIVLDRHAEIDELDESNNFKDEWL